MPWRLLAVILLVLTMQIVRVPAQEEPPEEDVPQEEPEEAEPEYEPPKERAWLGPWSAEHILLGFATIRSADVDGTRLEGFRVSMVEWDEESCVFGGRGHWWLQVERNGDQRIHRLGADAALTFLSIGPLRVLPIGMGIGVGDRRLPPHEGLEVFLNIEFEAALWLGKNFQIAWTAERTFSAPAGTRDHVAVSLRWNPPGMDW